MPMSSAARRTMAAETSTTILPSKWQGQRETIHVANINAWRPAERLRAPDLGDAVLKDLADSIERQGLMQPIGVKRFGLRYNLIWGFRRAHAYAAHRDRLGPTIEAVVYPEDLPDQWAAILEVDENLKRQDLTPDERAEHTLRLAAEIKSLEEKVEPGKPDKSDFTSGQTVKPKPTTGRGHKGIIQKTAEHLRVDQAAVRKRAQKVADTIGEPVDLQADSPAELTRKAEKFRATPKPGRGPAKATAFQPQPDSRAARIGIAFEAMSEVWRRDGEEALWALVEDWFARRGVEVTFDRPPVPRKRPEPALVDLDPAPRAGVQLLLASGKWDLPRLTEHMSKHAKPGKVTLDNVTAWLNGKSGSYHVQRAARAVWSELRDYI
jgi:ParB/RepB/Spo0J family partition protein